MAEKLEHRLLRRRLAADGWLSPDSYSNDFGVPVDGSAVYLFALFDRYDFNTCIVAYAGMSTNLKKRWARHEVLRAINGPEHWVKRWFKPVRREQLRAQERALINTFDPPWNIIGRRRGLSS
jgi:hypothetical protein